MKAFSLLIPAALIMISTNIVRGADPQYPVSDIPGELLANAKAIIRSEDIVFTVNSPSSAVKSVTYAVTVLNENGYYQGRFVQFYDKYSSIQRISGTIYDSQGEKVRRITSNDIIDHSAISGSSVFDDSRVKLIDPEYRIFPFTVVYSFTISYSGIIDYPDWIPVPDYNVAVQQSKYTAVVPKDMEFRYYPSHLPTSVKESSDGVKHTYSWHIEDIPAMTDELFSLPIMQVMPVLFVAPADFRMDGKAGNSSTWSDFGKWIFELTDGRDELSPERVQEIRKIAAGITDEREIARALYEYMQGKTRYVSIQIGIGGWQPFKAERVDETSYGDCKALTNYMKALLDVAGIPSVYTLVRAGAHATRMVTDFPSNQFNHAILCVPLREDTLWLECTDQQIPFGYLGDFTDDREVLLVKEDGGVLGHTKIYTAGDNSIITKAIIDLYEDGSGHAQMITAYSGVHYQDWLRIIHMDDKEQREKIIGQIYIPSINLVSYSLHEYRSEIPSVEETVELELPNYCSTIGDRLLVPLHLNNAPEDIISTMFERRSDIDIRRSTLQSDTIVFVAPAGYGVDKIPEGRTIESEFGTYSFEVSSTKDQIKYIRTLRWNKGIYPKENISSLIDFIEKIGKYDGMKCSLKRIE